MSSDCPGHPSCKHQHGERHRKRQTMLRAPGKVSLPVPLPMGLPAGRVEVGVHRGHTDAQQTRMNGATFSAIHKELG